jgi:hypothetical protein
MRLKDPVRIFREVRENTMNMRSIRVVAFLIPLLTVGGGVALASSGSAGVGAGNSSSAAFCPADLSSGHRRASHASTHGRLALHCYCCGKDENGHCNHQCCD